MKLAKKSILISSLLLGSTIFGAELNDLKNQAPIQKLLPNSYANVQLRGYYSETVKKANNSSNLDPKIQVRATLGSTFFDGMLDSNLVVGANNYLGKDKKSNLVTYRGTFLSNKLTVYENDFVSVVPYLNVKLPSGEYGTNAALGLSVPVSYDLDTKAGSFDFKVGFDAKTYLASKTDSSNQMDLLDEQGNKMTKATHKDLGFSLNKKDEYQVGADSRSYKGQVGVGVEFSPKVLPGLELELAGEFSQKYVPVMEYSSADKTVASKYNLKEKSEQTYKAAVSYELTESLSLSNSLYVESKDKENVYTNILALSADLF